MFGAICGDIIGSYYEHHYTKEYDFELFHNGSCFTDDTVLTAAVCDVLLSHRDTSEKLSDKQYAEEYAYRYRQYYSRYPNAGFGEMFQEWARSDNLYKQKSYGNGAAMRVVPIAYAFDNVEDVLNHAKLSALYTHNNKEAIIGAQAVVASVFLALKGYSKNNIREYISKNFGYNLSVSIDEIRKTYVFDSRTGYSVPPAIMAFLQSDSYEDAVRKAVSLGGDADTMACIAGGIAEAYYKIIPENIRSKCWSLLDSGIKNIIRHFCEAYVKK